MLLAILKTVWHIKHAFPWTWYFYQNRQTIKFSYSIITTTVSVVSNFLYPKKRVQT
jgi:hypothetical protein